MSARTGRLAALLGLGTAFALAVPAQAHHYYCNGYRNPECNVRYILDHWSMGAVAESPLVGDLTTELFQARDAE